MDPQDIVRSSYDRVAEVYRERYGQPNAALSAPWVGRLTKALTAGVEVLDLGCGAGDAMTGDLAQHFNVVGVDISPVQIQLARQRVPRGEFICADMTEVEFTEGRFAAIVALYSLIHVPFDQQRPLLARIAGWLRRGGYFLGVVGHQAWTGIEDDWLGVEGATMYWSHADAATYRQWLTEAGLEVLEEQFVPEGDGGHTLFWCHR